MTALPPRDIVLVNDCSKGTDKKMFDTMKSGRSKDLIHEKLNLYTLLKIVCSTKDPNLNKTQGNQIKPKICNQKLPTRYGANILHGKSAQAVVNKNQLQCYTKEVV